MASIVEKVASILGTRRGQMGVDIRSSSQKTTNFPPQKLREQAARTMALIGTTTKKNPCT